MSKWVVLVASVSFLSACAVQHRPIGSTADVLRAGSEIGLRLPGLPTVPGQIGRSTSRAPRFFGTCEQVGDWLSDGSWPEQHAKVRGQKEMAMDDVVLLISEPRFSKHFGKPYVEMTESELRPYSSSLLGKCFTTGGSLATLPQRQKSAAGSALVFYAQRANLAAAERKVKDLTAIDELIAQVNALKPTEADANALGEIAEHSESRLAAADDRQRDQLHLAIMEADQRVAIPVERARVDALLARPSRPEDLPALVSEQTREHKASTSPVVQQARAGNLHRLDEAVSTALTAASMTERQAIDGLGTGLGGLAAGSRWNAEYKKRYGSLVEKNVQLHNIISYFVEKRQSVLVGAQPAFRKELGVATDPGALSSHYLVAVDEATPIGKQYFADVQGRIAAVRKWKVLGSDPEADRRAPKGSPDEPTQGEMYDALSMMMERAAANTKQLSGCEVNGRTNVADGVLCLMFKGANAVGGGEAMQLTSFEKLGCVKPNNRYGFVCSYQSSVSGGVTNSPLLGASGGLMQSLMQSGSRNDALFGRNKDGWYYEELPKVKVIQAY